MQLLVYDPARFQEEYLGRAYGTPLSLRSFQQSGFQDPHSEWRYALSSKDVASLSKRCLPRPGDSQRCFLFSGSNDRWIAEVELEGNELRVSEGLW